MGKRIAYKVLWILIVFVFGLQMITTSHGYEILTRNSQSELFGYTMKNVIFLFIGTGAIGIWIDEIIITNKRGLTV